MARKPTSSSQLKKAALALAVNKRLSEGSVKNPIGRPGDKIKFKNPIGRPGDKGKFSFAGKRGK